MLTLLLPEYPYYSTTGPCNDVITKRHLRGMWVWLHGGACACVHFSSRGRTRHAIPSAMLSIIGRAGAILLAVVEVSHALYV